MKQPKKPSTIKKEHMAKPIENSNQLLKIRHTTEHVLTMAMLKLYGADKVTMAMGPATDDGFYFDFDGVNW